MRPGRNRKLNKTINPVKNIADKLPYRKMLVNYNTEEHQQVSGGLYGRLLTQMSRDMRKAADAIPFPLMRDLTFHTTKFRTHYVRWRKHDIEWKPLSQPK